MSNRSDDGYLVPKVYAWYIFGLVFMLMIFDYIDRQIIASLFPFLKQEWGLSDVQCGMLVAALNWSITIFAFPVGLLADRWSRKKTVGLMSTIWSLGALACAFPQSYYQLFATRFLVGAGEAGYAPVGTALISALFPQRLRSRLIGVFMGAATLGSAIGVALGGWIAVSWGWRYAFGIVGIPGLIFAVMFFFTRDYKTVELTMRAGEAKDSAIRRMMTKKDIMANLFGRPSVVALYLVSITGFFFLGGLAAWLPSYFIRVANLPVAEASLKTGLSVLVCVFGNYLVGHIADTVVRWGRVNGYALVAAASQLCSGLLYAAAFGLAQGQTQFCLLILAGIVLTAFVSPAYSALSELVHPGLRSSVISINVLLLNALGFSTGPIFAGLLSDRYGIETAMVALSVVPLISMLVSLVAAKLYSRDLAKVERVELQAES
jgi:MFS transporter, Spinster family, sphingosine-1-phosphate transporter